MAIKFSSSLKGPSITIDETVFTFKRINEQTFNKWFIKLGIKTSGQELKFDELSPDKQVLIIENESRFLSDNLYSFDNLINEDTGKPFKPSEMTEEIKVMIFEELLDSNKEFAAFSDAYRSGVKKKL